MPSPNLPTTVVAETTEGHAAGHSAVAPFLNQFDVAMIGGDGSFYIKRAGLYQPFEHPGQAGRFLRSLAEDPYAEWSTTAPSGGGGATSLSELSDVDLTGLGDDLVLKYDAAASQWIPQNDVSGGGGFGGDLGFRWVDPSAADNTGDGLSPATAKRDIAAAVNSISGSFPGGGRIFLSGRNAHPVGSTVSTGSKALWFQGMGRGATVVRPTGNVRPVFNLQNRFNRVSDLTIDASAVPTAVVGGVRVNQKNQTVKNVGFIGIGAGVNGSFNPEDSGAPYGLIMETYNISQPAISDWAVLEDLWFDSCYRFIIAHVGMNCQIDRINGRNPTGGAAFYEERGGSGLNSAMSVQNVRLWDIADQAKSTRDNNSVFYLRSSASGGALEYLKCRFLNIRSIATGNQGAHIYCDVKYMTYENMHFEGKANRFHFGPAGNSPTNFIGNETGTTTGYLNSGSVSYERYRLGSH